jgi:phage-related protein
VIPNELWWLGDSRRRLRNFPEEVRWEIGGAIESAVLGQAHSSTRPMQGLNAMEIVSDDRGNTYRCVFTTRFKDHVYVLHSFQKKSKTGIKTPKPELELIEKRLKDAEAHYKQLQSTVGIDREEQR